MHHSLLTIPGLVIMPLWATPCQGSYAHMHCPALGLAMKTLMACKPLVRHLICEELHITRTNSCEHRDGHATIGEVRRCVARRTTFRWQTIERGVMTERLFIIIRGSFFDFTGFYYRWSLDTIRLFLSISFKRKIKHAQNPTLAAYTTLPSTNSACP